MTKKTAERSSHVSPQIQSGALLGGGLGGGAGLLGGGLLGAGMGRAFAEDQGGLFGPSDREKMLYSLGGGALGALLGGGLGAGVGALGGAGTGAAEGVTRDLLGKAGITSGDNVGDSALASSLLGMLAGGAGGALMGSGEGPLGALVGGGYGAVAGGLGGGLSGAARGAITDYRDKQSADACSNPEMPKKNSATIGGALLSTADPKHVPAHKPPHTVAPTPDDHYKVEVKEAELDDLHWRVLSTVYGEKNAAYLRDQPLNRLVRNKIAKDFPEQNTREDFSVADVIGHVAEKYAEARRRWATVEEGLDSIRHLEKEGLIQKTARLLPRGCIERKQLQRGVHKLAEDCAPPEMKPALTAIREEYDRQFDAFLGPDREKSAAMGSGLVDTMKGLYEGAMGNPLARKAMTGLVGGGAAAVPIVAGGKMLLSDAEERAQKAMVPMAVASGAGHLLGGIGGGMAQRFMGGA